MGFVKYWWQMAICRVLLGFFEAGLFPACAYLISTWYTRQEIQKRMTGFFMLTVLIGGFSSAITAGISALQGKAGLSGWQWIFVSYFTSSKVLIYKLYLALGRNCDHTHRHSRLSPRGRLPREEQIPKCG
jgi:MFS family permease